MRSHIGVLWNVNIFDYSIFFFSVKIKKREGSRKEIYIYMGKGMEIGDYALCRQICQFFFPSILENF
jgi:hypothetical protein